MIGTRVRVTIFNGNSKFQRFFADINGTLYTWFLTMCLGLAVTLAAQVVFGYEEVLQFLAPARNFLTMFLGDDALLKALALTTGASSFILVFMLRRNFFVHPKRPFRYFCRWL